MQAMLTQIARISVRDSYSINCHQIALFARRREVRPRLWLAASRSRLATRRVPTSYSGNYKNKQ